MCLVQWDHQEDASQMATAMIWNESERICRRCRFWKFDPWCRDDDGGW